MTRGAAVGKIAETQVVLVFVDNEGPTYQVQRSHPLQKIRIGTFCGFDVAQVARMAFCRRAWARSPPVFTRRALVIVVAGPQTALPPQVSRPVNMKPMLPWRQLCKDGLQATPPLAGRDHGLSFDDSVPKDCDHCIHHSYHSKYNLNKQSKEESSGGRALLDQSPKRPPL